VPFYAAAHAVVARRELRTHAVLVGWPAQPLFGAVFE